MDIFKEYPGELCTVGSVNGLWWTQSTEAETVLFAVALYSVHIIEYIQNDLRKEFSLT